MAIRKAMDGFSAKGCFGDTPPWGLQMRIQYEVSAGGLALRRRVGSGFDLLLIGRGEPRVWSLPKGHVEANESNEAAAIREVREETGCNAAIIEKLSEIAYWFYINSRKHKKSVHFYLMRYLNGETADHDHEADEAAWFELEGAKNLLKYVNEKRLVDLALRRLEGLPPEIIGPRPAESR